MDANGIMKTGQMNQNVDTWITLMVHHTGTMKTAMKSNVDSWITLMVHHTGTMKTAMKSQLVASGMSGLMQMIVKESVEHKKNTWIMIATILENNHKLLMKYGNT
jgi:hypothetical protein